MARHRGDRTVVNTANIIGIFDIENTSVSKDTKEFLRIAGHTGQVVNVSYEMPKSYVVCREKETDIVYISQISTATLKKRLMLRSK